LKGVLEAGQDSSYKNLQLLYSKQFKPLLRNGFVSIVDDSPWKQVGFTPHLYFAMEWFYLADLGASPGWFEHTKPSLIIYPIF
jgi:hypothetical protein